MLGGQLKWMIRWSSSEDIAGTKPDEQQQQQQQSVSKSPDFFQDNNTIKKKNAFKTVRYI